MPEETDQPLRIRQEGRVLALEGELDMADTDALLEAAATLAERPGDLTLDLSGLTFIDSTGLLGLLRTADRVHGGSLTLLRPTEQVRKVFDMVELAKVSPRIVITG